MITLTLVAILGFLLIVVLSKLFRKSRAVLPAAPARPAIDLASLKITDARAGDAVSIPGAGDQFTDLDFTVDRRMEYVAGDRRWCELSGQYRDRRIAIEAASNEEIEAAIVDPKRLTLEDLGLSEDDLGQIDQRQDAGDNFEFEGKPWFYRFSKEVSVTRDGLAASPFYCWRFEEEGGKRTLSIRKPEGEPFWASVAAKVNPRDIVVYRS